MNVNLRKFTLLFTACLFACPFARAAEQDNWYLHGPIDDNLSGVFHQEYDAVNKQDMLYTRLDTGQLRVYDINGSFLEEIDARALNNHNPWLILNH